MNLTQEEIVEGNKLFAEFMNLKVVTFNGLVSGSSKHYAALQDPLITVKVGNEGTLYYHKSWDWLFPVIDKINDMGKGYSFAIFKTYVSLTVEKGGKIFKDFSFAYSEYITAEQTGKVAAFKLLVRFIKWHNEQVLTNKLEPVE